MNSICSRWLDDNRKKMIHFFATGCLSLQLNSKNKQNSLRGLMQMAGLEMNEIQNFNYNHQNYFNPTLFLLIENKQKLVGCCSWNNHRRWLWVTIEKTRLWLLWLSKTLKTWVTLLPCEPQKKPSYTGCLIGILPKVYHNLHTTGQHNPLDYITQPTRSSFFFVAHVLHTP